MNNKIQEIDFDSLPTLPTVYQALMEKLENPKATINDIADTIILDISSTSKLLQIVNSSMFSFQTKINTISQAISLLGFNEVRNVILTIAITDYFKNFKRDKDFIQLDLWQHSIAAGIIAKLIAKELRLSNPETLFISGLLHDVGKLILITTYQKEYFNLLFNSHLNDSQLCQLEVEKFGFSHDEVGYELVKKWNIGLEIAESIKYHHHLNYNSENRLNISIIYLANIIAKIMNLGKSGNLHINKPDDRIWSILNLRPGFIKSIHKEIEKQFYESSLILKL